MDLVITPDQWDAFLRFLPTISAVAAAFGLIFTVITIRKSNETRELHITERIVSDLQNLEREFYDKYMEKPEEDKKKWDSLFFNNLEWFSFLINEKKIKDKKIINFFKDSIINWHEDIFVENIDHQDLENPKVYAEFKKLYKKLKEQSGND